MRSLSCTDYAMYKDAGNVAYEFNLNMESMPSSGWLNVVKVV